MDVEAIAAKLQRLRVFVEQAEGDSARTRRHYDAAPFGFAELAIDPGSTAAAASLNRNRIYLCGRAGGLTFEGLSALIEQFKASAVPRFFVWLNPGPQRDRVREWIRELRLQPVVWTRYPTLALTEPAQTLERRAFDIHIVTPAEIAAARTQFGYEPMAGFEQTAGRVGFHHYLLYDAGRPIAGAALVQFEDVGCLTYAHTTESQRGRGAQTALIEKRCADARRLGCPYVISQTLTMLESSFANLQRCGFREIYEQEVCEGRT